MRLAALLALAACSTAASGAAPDAPPTVVVDARPPADAPPPPADATPPDAAVLAPRYTTDRTYSPITAAVARNLRTIAQRNGDALQDDVFMKVGDSITVDPSFLACFDGAFDLGAHADLMPTLTFFKGGDAAGSDPFKRVSLAAGVGWSADAALAGSPSPLEDEQGAIMPRYAVVMFGSNDVVARSIYQYAANLLTIVDDLEAVGVIPILSSIPPQTQSATGTANVPRYNAVSRGIASARLLPYMDYGKEMELLPGLGLGPDGLHPNAYPGGACKLTADGLKYGYNTRNLLTLASLARTRGAVEGEPLPDPEPTVAAVTGAGSYDQPFVVYGFPFTDLRDTSQSTNKRFTTYTGCAATQDESGPEYIYKLSVAAPITVRAIVMVRDNVDIDVHLLSGLDVADCIQRNDKEIVAALNPGTYYFALDTFVPADGVARSGEYLFVVVSE